ncbi:MAG: shikimate dehydrogenase, partial [Solirubrobacterales bacterium]
MEGQKKLAVVGHPIAHSRSPAMQGAALADLGLAGEWEYMAIDIEPDQFESGIQKLVGSGFVGVNVTVPHKESALRLSGTASTIATEIGAANALTFGPDGVQAENFDGPALAEFLPDDLGGG